MSSRIRNLMGWSLLAVYGALALLGHAGMHALDGSHVHAPEVADARSHSHAHGCCHDHAHDPDGHSHEQHDHQHRDGHGHDHDTCLICHHFAAKAALVSIAAPLNLAAGLELVACVCSETPSAADGYVLPIRGPPACDC